jgi:hypothetical protein
MARLIAALVASLASLALLSCGGGGDDDAKDKTNAKANQGDKTHAAAVNLSRQASGPNAKASSGVIDAGVELALKGVPEYAEPFSTTISGPFQYRKGAALPDYELDLGARDYGVTLTSVNGKSYVTIGTTAYELPAAIRQRLVRNAGTVANGMTRTFQQFGVRPWVWETEQRVAGSGEVMDGVKTTHLSTSFNAGRQLKDATTLLGVMRSLGITRAVGLPPTISRAARRLFVTTVTLKVGDSWFGIDDKVRRKSAFTLRFRVPKAARKMLGGLAGGVVKGGLTVTEVGKPQKIKAPTELGSYADFKLALDALGDARESK